MFDGGNKLILNSLTYTVVMLSTSESSNLHGMLLPWEIIC
jgi:hypothetical protein